MKIKSDFDIAEHAILQANIDKVSELGGLRGSLSGSPGSKWSSALIEGQDPHYDTLRQTMPSASGVGVSIPSNEECGIKDVWKHNLEEEFRTIRQVVKKYHWVAMDTEFPGVVARPIGEFRSTADYQYQLLRCNVDLLRIIQLGLTFMDENGKTPPGYTTWQFNFKFNLHCLGLGCNHIRGVCVRKTCQRTPQELCQMVLWACYEPKKKFELFYYLVGRPPRTAVKAIKPFAYGRCIGAALEDMYAQDSIDLLQNSGLQFRKHEEDGIEPLEFAELLMTSGIVLMDNIKWLSFHSGYDFGYLLKLLTDQNLPQDESDFFESLRLYFPTVYDVKYLMKLCKNLKGGLQEVAEQLELRRVGPQHQAGSDSLLTGMAFFKIKEIFFDDNIESSSGHLYGLGAPFSVNGNSFHDNGDNSSSS